MAQASDAVFVLDAGGKVIETNAMACVLADLPPAQCSTLDPRDVFELPECGDVAACLSRLTSGQTLRTEGRFRRPGVDHC